MWWFPMQMSVALFMRSHIIIWTLEIGLYYIWLDKVYEWSWCSSWLNDGRASEKYQNRCVCMYVNNGFMFNVTLTFLCIFKWEMGIFNKICICFSANSIFVWLLDGMSSGSLLTIKQNRNWSKSVETKCWILFIAYVKTRG